MPDIYAIRYEDMHPVLQGYFDRLDHSIQNTFARLIHHALDGELLFVREFITQRRIMCERCWEANIDSNKLAEDVIEYCNNITENDIEYYR